LKIACRRHRPNFWRSNPFHTRYQYYQDLKLDVGLFRDLDFLRGHATGSVYLTESQYCLLYPASEKYHEKVGVLDLACVLGEGRDRGLFFQILAESFIPALQRNFSVDPSMPALLKRQIGFVRLLGKFVGCGSELTWYRGVLDSVKLEWYQSAEIVVLVFNSGRSVSELHSSRTEEPIALRSRKTIYSEMNYLLPYI
jgi:hypothetical protein